MSDRVFENYRPGDVVWTVFPWPEIYDHRARDIDLRELDVCNAVQVIVRRRVDNMFMEDKKPPYEVQFLNQDEGEAVFGRFGQTWDEGFLVMQARLFRDKKGAVELAAAGLIEMRNGLNKGIEHLFGQL